MDPILDPLIDRIRAAAESGTPLRIRGGGSKDFYGERLEGELLETAAAGRHHQLRAHRAGGHRARRHAAGRSWRRCWPSAASACRSSRRTSAAAPPSAAWWRPGLSGPARASAGAVRDYVLGMTLVNGRGELLTFGGQVMKNVAGYDVSRLVTGSLGTLGLIVEVSLKVLPVAPGEATLKFEMSQAEALQRLDAVGRPAAAPERQLLGRRRRRATRCTCACAARWRRWSRPAARWAASARTTPRSRPTGPCAATSACPGSSERGERDLWRLSVAQTAPVLDLPEPPLVEWHGGQRWVRAEPGDGAALREAAARAGGHATLFAPGRDRAAPRRAASRRWRRRWTASTAS